MTDILTRFYNADLVFRLPLSPPVNNLYLNMPRVGRVKSKRYRAWEAAADQWYALQKLHVEPKVSGPYSCEIVLPKVRGDIDGRPKAILDWCVSRNVTDDDKHLVRLVVTVDDGLPKADVWIALTRVKQ